MQAVVGMVQEAMTFVDQVPDVEIKVELIKTLSTVTAGKVRARRPPLPPSRSCPHTLRPG